MAPFDAPHVTHDMMLRFMGANFSAIVDGSAKIPSSLGNVAKPVFVETDTKSTSVVMPAKTPQQDKAMWEGMCPLTMTLALTFYLTHSYFPAYYNAGSATLVLILIFIVIAIFIWYRIRRNRVQLPTHQDQGAEETIPLTRRGNGDEEEEVEDVRQRKGKERELAGSPIFNVGDSEDEEEYRIINGN